MTARIEQNARGLQVIDLFAGGGGMSTGRKSYAGGSGGPGATIDIDADVTDA